MLVITRRPNESLLIYVDGELIRVTVSEARGNRVKLVLNGSDEVRFWREESGCIWVKDSPNHFKTACGPEFFTEHKECPGCGRLTDIRDVTTNVEFL